MDLPRLQFFFQEMRESDVHMRTKMYEILRACCRLHSCLSRLGRIHTHPCLLNQTQQLLHVRTPVIHYFFGASFASEVHDTSRPVDTSPYSVGYDETRQNFFRLFQRKI